MAAQDQVIAFPTSKTQVLQVFISYTREDENIAMAVEAALRTALGSFSNVFRDNALSFGLSFQDEIKDRLENTDLLVVLSSGTMREAFNFPGMELGYFMSTLNRGLAAGRPRKIVPIYLDTPPGPAAGIEGIQIGISRATLALTFEEYSASLKIDSDDPMVRFLTEFQALADKYAETILEENGLPKPTKTPEQLDLCGLVRNMQLSIFRQLKTKPESTLKPQKQITIKTSDSALELAKPDLPADALLAPIGTGTMFIFGLDDQEITWSEFSKRTSSYKFRDSWVDAITSVVTSSMGSQLDIDNSQVIVSNDEHHAFRVILTTGTRYFNGIREFNLYFVEYLPPRDFGDADTTRVLKGLDLSCRFRFLFLEKNSEFSHMNVRIAAPNAIRDLVRNIERELNLLQRDATRMGLDKPYIWADFVDWAHLLKLSEEWRPLEAKIRDCCAQIRGEKEDSALIPLRDRLVDAIEQLAIIIAPLNSALICELADGLKKLCSCSSGSTNS